MGPRNGSSQNQIGFEKPQSILPSGVKPFFFFRSESLVARTSIRDFVIRDASTASMSVNSFLECMTVLRYLFFRECKWANDVE